MSSRNFTPSPAQQAYFDWIDQDEGSAVLEAVAGAGKTTTLIKGLDHMGGQVAFLAFNAKIVNDIKAKVGGRRGVWPQTFHSAGLKALKWAFKDRALATDSKKLDKIAKRMIEDSGRLDLQPLVGAAVAMASMAKQRGIGATVETPDIEDDAAWLAMIDHFALDDQLPEGMEGAVVKAMAFARALLNRSNADLDVIDFDDMVYLPLAYDLKFLKHDWVLVDEAQDTNPTRRAIAERMLGPNGRLVAVGDPAQAIYGFTGTDNDSLEQIEAAFACKRLPLTVTYRCPKTVVEVARRYVSHITAHESAPDGQVLGYEFSDLEFAGQTLVQVGDAVLCRFNKYLVDLAFRFIRQGLPAKIEGRDLAGGLIKLATRWKSVKTLNALEGRLEEWLDREKVKAKAKDDEARAQRAEDQVETLKILIARARELGGSRVEDVVEVISGLFGDSEKGDMRDCVVLCSIHKSKGLEWRRVHVLGLDELTGRTSRDWQAAQEVNLKYVAVTRAMDTLYLVRGVAEPKGAR